jgi:soluble lytic murein transglycosylase-like protein
VKVTAKAALLAVMLIPAAACASASSLDSPSPLQCAEFYASTYHVPLELVEAVIEVESSWNPYAISSKGAEGLMQLMPATAVRFGVYDRFDIEENIRGGVA